MTLIPERVDTFFSTARERHSIYLRRKGGQSPPFSDDPIFQYWRFTNVFRELDKTTVWFKENVRESLRTKPEVLLATVVFRFFNRIGTGEAIFKQFMVGHNQKTAWECFLLTGDIGYLKHSILTYIGLGGPYVTGSYIVKTPEGFTKLDGVLEILKKFYHDEVVPPWQGVEHGSSSGKTWRDGSAWMLEQHPTLQSIHEWLESRFYYIGHFTAYEITSDLRWTDLLSNAPDIMTWANAGPGATRGLNYLYGRDRNKTPSKGQLVEEMRELLELSQSPDNWQNPEADYITNPWPVWEMREVEHWCCEYMKYVRARDEGRGTRQRFRS